MDGEQVPGPDGLLLTLLSDPLVVAGGVALLLDVLDEGPLSRQLDPVVWLRLRTLLAGVSRADVLEAFASG